MGAGNAADPDSSAEDDSDDDQDPAKEHEVTAVSYLLLAKEILL